MTIRPPAVAGQFYSDDPILLRNQLESWLSVTSPSVDGQGVGSIRAVIVPHAGYIYSGETAAKAYALIKLQQLAFNKVILIGPSHHYYFDGCAFPESDQFSSPLGSVTVCAEDRQALENHPLVIFSDQAHRTEHSLEVQLPFLQSCLIPGFQLTPILTSHISAQDLASIISPLWQENTLLVISSDLSHFHQYAEARKIDRDTCDQIEAFQSSITPKQACGSTGINTLLLLAQQRHYQLHQLQQLNSGDTAGDKSRVVGYASYIITEL